jgi:hypothetical protein
MEPSFPPRSEFTVAQFAIQLSKGETITIAEADTYQFEGPLITFFSTGSSRQVIDSWSTRVASYRTADVVSIERFDLVLPLESGNGPLPAGSTSASQDIELDIRGLAAA